MGRSVLCDESLLEQLEQISNNKGFTPGLILGQFTNQKDYVIHLPQTPTPSENYGNGGDPGAQETSFIKFEDIDENLISNHARIVTRMLPGGMWVLGYFVAGPTDIFGDKKGLSKIRTIGNAIYNCTKGNEFLCGKDPSNQLLVLHFNSLSRKFTCKVLEMNSISSSLRPADWKFKSNPTKWLTVTCNVILSWFEPFIVSSRTLSKQKKLLECLKQFQEQINGYLPLINYEYCPPDTNLAALKENQNGSNLNKEMNKEGEENDSDFNVLFFDSMESSQNSKKSSTKKEIIFDGVIVSKVFLNEKSTAEDALKAVRDDLVRSLAARLEMHWQTYEEPEKRNGELLVEIPPRRVLFTPEGWKLSFSEYLFEGETEEDAKASISENVGLTEGSIVAVEDVWDTQSLEDLNKSKKLKSESDSNKRSSQKTKNEVLSNNFLLIGIVAAVITLILSLVIQFMYS